MSHITTIKTEIYDLDILIQTLRDLKIKFIENGDIQGRQKLKADVLVFADSRCSFGFKRMLEKKAYEIKVPEEFARLQEIRETVRTILAGYAYRKVLHETRRRGFALVQEERINPGTIKLVLRKVA